MPLVLSQKKTEISVPADPILVAVLTELIIIVQSVQSQCLIIEPFWTVMLIAYFIIPHAKGVHASQIKYW